MEKNEKAIDVLFKWCGFAPIKRLFLKVSKSTPLWIRKVITRRRLKKASKYLANKVNPEMFDMSVHRNAYKIIDESNLVGNVMWHLTALDKKFENDPKYFRDSAGEVWIGGWATTYFGLSFKEYLFIVNPTLVRRFPEYTNKQHIAHAIERIDYMRIYGKVPDGYKDVEDCEKFPLGFSKVKENE